MMITKLLAVASLASAVVVRDAAILRAELARGAPSIELAADINLGGVELTVSTPAVDPRGDVADECALCGEFVTYPSCRRTYPVDGICYSGPR